MTMDPRSVPGREAIEWMDAHDPVTLQSVLQPAQPLSVAESNALAGEGTISAALAVNGWRYVQCEHGSIRAEDWHEHTHAYSQVGPDQDTVRWIERVPDHVHDCVLILESSSEVSDR